MKSTILKVLLLILALAAVAGTATVIFGEREKDRKEKERIEEANRRAEEYKEEREEIREKVKDLNFEKKQMISQSNKFTTMIYNQASKNLMEEVYKEVTTKMGNAPASFVISDVEMMGKEGCITFEDYKKLLSENWTCMVGLPKEGTDLETYLKELQALFKKEQLSFPTAFYFRVGSFNEKDLQIVKDYGFKTVAYALKDENAFKEPPSMEEEHPVFYLPYLYMSSNQFVKEDVIKILTNEEKGFVGVSTGKVQASVSSENELYDLQIIKAKAYLYWASTENKFYISEKELYKKRYDLDITNHPRLLEIERELDLLEKRDQELKNSIDRIYENI